MEKSGKRLIALLTPLWITLFLSLALNSAYAIDIPVPNLPLICADAPATINNQLFCMASSYQNVGQASSPTTGVIVNVMIIYDEEINALLYPLYTNRVPNFLVGIVETADDPFEQQFNINLRVVDVKFWNSPNDKAGCALMWAAQAFAGFTSGMNTSNGVIHILILFTLQPNCWSWAGLSLPYQGIVMVRFQSFWLDARVLQHELSHLYMCALGDHTDVYWCIMSLQCGWTFPYLYGPGYVRTRDWCDTCKATIQANKYKYMVTDNWWWPWVS